MKRLHKKYILKIIIFILFTILIFITILSILFKKDKIEPSDKNFNLKNDGFCIFHNILNSEEINNLKSFCNNKDYKNVQDYLLNNDKL